MSGTDLAGITPLARNDGSVEAAPLDGNGADVNGMADDRVHRQAGMGDQERPCAGLPSTVIHELRTPLTSIHGYAQVLQRSLRDNPRATNALGVVVRETTRLSAMLASLSELAELQSGEAFSPAVEVDVHQLAEDVVQDVQRRDGGAHPILLDGHGVACCNATLLAQAMLHVVANAALYSPAGEAISVGIAERGTYVEISVSDRGIGIVPADGERIYEPFERGSNARQLGSRGLGLGLFLAREALSRTRGRIDHRPGDDGGATFRLTVPRA
jgi:two-component system, OmpR family, sensor histidine kinase SenX3